MRLQHPPAWLRPPARRRAGAQPWRVVRPPLRSRVGPDSLRHVRLTSLRHLRLALATRPPVAREPRALSLNLRWRRRRRRVKTQRSHAALQRPAWVELTRSGNYRNLSFCVIFPVLRQGARVRARARGAHSGGTSQGEEPPESVPSAVSVSLERGDSAVRAPVGRTALDLPRPSEGRRVSPAKSAMERGRFTP